jgi:unsaturated rhamnogalacturonyl hydrolase
MIGVGVMASVLLGAWSAAEPAGAQPATAALTVTVTNDLDLPRPSETIEVPAAEIQKVLSANDLRKVRVRDERLKREILAQAIDMDRDVKPDLVVFQADLEPRETRSFTLTLGEPPTLKAADFKVYGRFSRERADDFLWENDLVAHRMYGRGLESWPPEPLTSSTVDVWCKRTRQLVINDWLMVDDYHADHGEGADFYSAGKSRGCGGSGLYEDDQLHASRNFTSSRVLAGGPIRLVFELTYEPWAIGRRVVSETKRVTLDAGSHFNRFESVYRHGLPIEREIVYAVGIKKSAGSTVFAEEGSGWLRTWEPVGQSNGNLGCAVVFDPARFVKMAETDLDRLVVLKAPQRGPAIHYAGSAWDRGGDTADVAAWEAHVKAFVKRLRSPVKVSFAPAR